MIVNLKLFATHICWIKFPNMLYQIRNFIKNGEFIYYKYLKISIFFLDIVIKLLILGIIYFFNGRHSYKLQVY